MITIQSLTGADVLPYIVDLAALRIRVFREYPYLYEGSMDYEKEYLRTYIQCPEALVVIVQDGDTVVGASTGIPMAEEVDEFRKPFEENGYNPEEFFYFGESVLLPEYRGQGIGVRFFQEREAFAQRLGRFRYTCFCAVDRPENHPARPANYQPLDAFWNKRGYVRHPELRTYFTWKEVGEAEESPKSMTFWLKSWSK